MYSVFAEQKVILPSPPISPNTRHGFDKIWALNTDGKAAKKDNEGSAEVRNEGG